MNDVFMTTAISLMGHTHVLTVTPQKASTRPEGGERLAPVVALNDFAGAESQDAVMVTIRTSSGTEDHWVVELKVQKIQPACQGKV